MIRPLVILFLITLCGCAEERVVRSSGPLQGLPGSKTQIEGGGGDLPTSLIPRITDSETIIENPDGTRSARATSVRQLMGNIARCLDEEWGETVFINYVLSDRARQEMATNGMSPSQAFQQLKSHRDDLMKLFNLMPMGEYTPGMFMVNVGPRTFRLQVSGKAADALYFRGIDAVYEKQSYRLYWFFRDQYNAGG